MRALASFITAAERLLVITGAGCSTESAIPDYRSPKGAYSTGFKPMTHQDFLRADGNRKRYWARSFVGWKKFAEGTSPNRASASTSFTAHAGSGEARIQTVMPSRVSAARSNGAPPSES